LFDNTPSSDWWIFLDMNQQVQLGTGQDSTEENSIILAASLADRGLSQRHAVGMVANGQHTIWHLWPQRRWEILGLWHHLPPREFIGRCSLTIRSPFAGIPAGSSLPTAVG
jgi:hypothetical protein